MPPFNVKVSVPHTVEEIEFWTAFLGGMLLNKLVLPQSDSDHDDIRRELEVKLSELWSSANCSDCNSTRLRMPRRNSESVMDAYSACVLGLEAADEIPIAIQQYPPAGDQVSTPKSPTGNRKLPVAYTNSIFKKIIAYAQVLAGCDNGQLVEDDRWSPLGAHGSVSFMEKQQQEALQRACERFTNTAASVKCSTCLRVQDKTYETDCNLGRCSSCGTWFCYLCGSLIATHASDLDFQSAALQWNAVHNAKAEYAGESEPRCTFEYNAAAERYHVRTRLVKNAVEFIRNISPTHRIAAHQFLGSRLK